MLVVRRAPLVPRGSLTTCTTSSSPSRTSSWMCSPRGSPSAPMMSEACRKAARSSPISTKAACIPGSTRHHPALVDIAHQAAALGALDDDLVHHAVFDHGDPGLRRGDIDQDFFAHWAASVVDLRGRSALGRPAGISSMPACPSSRPVSNSGRPMTPE